jgi:hypothetical protein
MEAKNGDRVALDAKKVGQPKRLGVIKKVTQGLSGVRYSIEWDDGTTSTIAPSFGNLTVEAGKAKKAAKKPTAKATAKKKKAKR